MFDPFGHNGGLFMKSKSIAVAQTPALVDASRVVPAIAALMVGAFLVLGAGFANSNTLHNATHDARHAFAFPCH